MNEDKNTGETPVKDPEIKKDGALKKETGDKKIPLREIIIRTDGLNIELVKSEVSILELREICRSVLESTYKKPNG